VAFDAELAGASANSWAVTTLAFRCRAVNLDQNSVVDIAAESECVR
jgi:hypothetical protein